MNKYLRGTITQPKEKQNQNLKLFNKQWNWVPIEVNTHCLFLNYEHNLNRQKYEYYKLLQVNLY